MKTLNLNVILNKGASFSLVIEVPDTDLTGYEFSSQMRKTTESDVVAEFDFEILNQTTHKGQVRWSLPIETSDDIVASVSNAEQVCRQTTPFVFDVKMKDTVNFVTRIIQGIVSVSPDVTRAEEP